MHALWLRYVHSRVGRCSRGLAWLSASICQSVFTFDGFTDAPPSTTRNSLEFHRGPRCCVARAGHEAFKVSDAA